MFAVADAERRIDRGRQIVARQQEIVAKFGGGLPNSVELLKAYERTLAVLEEALAAHRLRHESTTGNAFVEQAATVASMPDHEGQMCEVAHLVEIPREAGYHCELDHDTLH